MKRRSIRLDSQGPKLIHIIKSRSMNKSDCLGWDNEDVRDDNETAHCDKKIHRHTDT